MKRKLGHVAAALLVSLTVSGCASSIMDGIWGDSTETQATSASGISGGLSPDLATAADGEAVAKLYNEGLGNLKDGSYKSAIKDFSEVERQYPYSSWATKAIIMQAYAYYEQGKHDDAIVAANRFITLHPGHKDAGYAYYLVAMSNYNKIQDTKRDQTATRQALEALEEVSRRYPGTAMRRTPPSGLRSRAIIWPARKCRSAAIITSRAATWPASTASSGW
jgi:outer membrane protein assembly factor BamD